jgi:hypothetical protein
MMHVHARPSGAKSCSQERQLLVIRGFLVGKPRRGDIDFPTPDRCRPSGASVHPSTSSPGVRTPGYTTRPLRGQEFAEQRLHLHNPA